MKDYQKEKEEMKKLIEKLSNSNTQIKIELFKLKKQIKQINYRDISKIIINNYINKYETKFKQNKELKNKKEKAIYICKLLIGHEKQCYEKIVIKYYVSNINSHISTIFDEYGKKYIVGASYDENNFIEKVYEDYRSKILEEKS